MKLNLFYVLLMLLVCSAAFGDDIDKIIAPPSGSPQSGHKTEITVYVHNNGNHPLSVNLPDRLTLRIESASPTPGDPVETFATAVQPLHGKAPVLEGGAFVKSRYAFTVPAGLAGPVRMEIAELDRAFVMFRINPTAPHKTPDIPDTIVGNTAAPDIPEVIVAGAAVTPEKEASAEKIFARHQPYLDNFSAYKPMYFLIGSETDKSKFQLSFKYKFLNPKGGLVKEYKWLNGLYLGYTQTSFWDLKSESAPFRDTSYKPELFFISPNVMSSQSWLNGLFLQTGFQHESNGRDGNDSRSTNFLYTKSVFTFHNSRTRYFLEISPKIWAYIYTRVPS